MSFEGIDEWDENFLDEVLRIELDAISSRNPARPDPSPPPPPPPPPPPTIAAPPRNPSWFRSDHDHPLATPVPASASDAAAIGFGFSPPRELSQRFAERNPKPGADPDCEIVEPRVLRNGRLCGSGGGGGREVERLKRELSRVSKQLGHLDHECVELRRDKAKKDEQLKGMLAQIDAKDKEIHNLKRANVDASKRDLHCNIDEKNTRASYQASERTAVKCYVKSNEAIDPAVSELNRRIINDNSTSTSSGGSIKESYSSENNNVLQKFNKTVGVQTDISDCSNFHRRNLSVRCMSEKLLSIWGGGNNKRTRGDLRKEFLVSCSEDLFALFRCMRQSEIDANCCTSDSALHDTLSQLHATVTKMHNGSGQIHTLIEALLGLCASENVFIVDRSLRVLHSILRHLLSSEVLSNRKNSVLVEQSPADNVKDEWEIGKKQLLAVFNDIEKGLDEHENPGSILTNIRESDAQDPFSKVDVFYKKSTFIPFRSWISIFNLVQRVAVKNSKESIRTEALSIMILILMCSDPITEREKFGPMPLLESVHQLLQKEVGLVVQKQAVHLLFLLLNCPKMLTLFCTGGKGVTTETAEGQNDVLQQALSSILEDLSECLVRGETGTLELKLRREVILLLAYIASHGRSGFEVLLAPVRPHGVNFLESIVRVLASEMDAEIVDCAEAQALCKERNSLMREALILLNRLSSHPAYSKTTLEVLTGSNQCASLTIDIANRIPRRSRGQWKQHNRAKTPMEAEIVDLARLFRTRVFAFLGE
ncbi:uncharacterized protein LOC109728638 [Ananas comosus]|uniref:Uncharacterized protein LOC109728638 n=1 Tax=Ananas comosus TaxID=4615 RepID=A0A6P5HN10_ANACO|nr:uncharacterized protein LOC109728638 [Ananas comosus]